MRSVTFPNAMLRARARPSAPDRVSSKSLRFAGGRSESERVPRDAASSVGKGRHQQTRTHRPDPRIRRAERFACVSSLARWTRAARVLARQRRSALARGDRTDRLDLRSSTPTHIWRSRRLKAVLGERPTRSSPSAPVRFSTASTPSNSRAGPQRYEALEKDGPHDRRRRASRACRDGGRGRVHPGDIDDIVQRNRRRDGAVTFADGPGPGTYASWMRSPTASS